MKHIKTFEGRSVNPESIKGLEKFFEEFEQHKKMGNGRYYHNSLDRARNYDIPEIFREEFALLQFLYGGTYSSWRYNLSKEVANYIKKEVKKYTLNSILKKFDDDPDSFVELKTLLDKRPKFNDPGSFDSISDASVKYTYFLFHDAINKAPIHNDMNKYNL